MLQLRIAIVLQCVYQRSHYPHPRERMFVSYIPLKETVLYEHYIVNGHSWEPRCST